MPKPGRHAGGPRPENNRAYAATRGRCGGGGQRPGRQKPSRGILTDRRKSPIESLQCFLWSPGADDLRGRSAQGNVPLWEAENGEQSIVPFPSGEVVCREQVGRLFRHF